MASDDLRARIVEALMAWAETNNAPQYASMRRPATVMANANSRANAVMAVVQPELEWWHKARQDDLDAISSLSDERDRALAALQAVREAQSLGEALAAVAKHDGITTIQPTTKE